MKFILKVVFAPVIFVLWLSGGICSLILRISSIVLSFAAVLFAAAGIITVFTDSVWKGCIGLAIALALSPYGIPMLAALLLARVYVFRYWLTDRIYG